VPNRKVSIYTEGCLLAFVTDVNIRRATLNKSGIDELMKRLYFNYALQGEGVSEEDYKTVIEDITGESQTDFFDNFINGCMPYESIITKSLEYLGLELDHQPSTSYAEGRLGFKVIKYTDGFVVNTMYPGSPAETGGLFKGDKIIAVNGFACNGELDKWLSYFDDTTKTVTVLRNGVYKEISFPEVMRNFYMKYTISKLKDPDKNQFTAFEAWKSNR
jgi:predicted metalloprotease with PDZ domain